MLPYKTLITIDKDAEMPIYVQIANSIINEVVNGRIAPNTQLPSSRKLAEILDLHRKTIVAAYDELELQGWVYKKQSVGTFVIDNLPKVQSIGTDALEEPTTRKQLFLEMNYEHSDFDQYISGEAIHTAKYRFDDGYPDFRLAPLDALAKAYSAMLKNHRLVRSLNYARTTQGDYVFRTVLANYLKETRGIQTTPENILTTRGSLMAFYLLFTATLQKGDVVVAGEPGYNGLNKIVELQQGKLMSIPVDESGIQLEALEAILEKEKVKYVFVIPHHHHPTTVTLSPDRRVKLLQLSEEYGFGILEDDYDFDFHYNSSPVLPLASLGNNENVIYVGSFSKLIAPFLRLGFVVATRELIEHMMMLRRYIDMNGDAILERAVCHLIQQGDIKRYLNKSILVYRKRRDLLCDLFEQEMGELVQFTRPEGGMAVWVQFAPEIDLTLLAKRCEARGVFVSKPFVYFTRQADTNAARFGFASMNEEELVSGFNLLLEEVEVIRK